jgi:hypothetical protein
MSRACSTSYSGGKDQEGHGMKPVGTNSSWDPTGKLLTQVLVAVPLPCPGPLIWPAILGLCSWLPTRRQPQQALAVQVSPGTYSLKLLFLRSVTCSLPQGGKRTSNWDFWGARVELGLVSTLHQNTYWFFDGGSTLWTISACGILHSCSSCSQKGQSPHLKLQEECQSGRLLLCANFLILQYVPFFCYLRDKDMKRNLHMDEEDPFPF